MHSIGAITYVKPRKQCFTHPWDLNIDSYNRMDHLVDNFFDFPERRADAFIALGEGWFMCDNICRNKFLLKGIIQHATRFELDLMMNCEERVALAALPSIVTIYRGCFHANRHGLSWSLEREVAADFTLGLRYKKPGQDRLLITARIRRSRIVALKLDRQESEVIAARPSIVSVLNLGPDSQLKR